MEENKDKAEGKLQPSAETQNKDADAYGNLPRGLTPEELLQTGTQKLILNDLLKAEKKISEIEPYREKYYEIFTEKSVLVERLAKMNRAEILYSFCITSGGLIIGLANLFVEKNGVLALVMIAIGALLISGGILFKLTFKK